MKKVIIAAGIITASLVSIFSINGDNTLAANDPSPLASLPGITTKDTKPNSCVDCHKLSTQPRKFDGRLTTSLKKWTDKVPEELLFKAQRTVPNNVKLTGKHPDVSKFVKVIPNDCLSCHSSKSPNIPQFKQLLHVIHLTGKDNHFVKNYQGQCMHCHKLDSTTGTWGFGSGKAEW